MKKANELGIYDMSGNVMEWCWDGYDEYVQTAQTDPRGPSSDFYRVIRGGSYDFFEGECGVTNRDGNNTGYGFILNYLGFRAVLPPGQP